MNERKKQAISAGKSDDGAKSVNMVSATVSAAKTIVPIARLERVAADALRAIGVGPADAAIVLPVLMYAQLRDSTQGLMKIVERTLLPAQNACRLKVDQRTPGIFRVEGNGQIGMVVLTAATDVLIDATSHTGLAMGTTCGTASSTGAIGYYASRIAERNLVGIVMAGSPKTMAVHGGVDPVLGTNPIAIAVPWQGSSLVLDIATAAVPVFGLIQARDRNQPIEAGLAWNADGNETRDPASALAGAIRTFGGAKGSGLALMAEILTGALSGASLPGEAADNRGNLLLAIDPEPLIGRAQFEARVNALVAHVAASRPAHAGQPVRMPGQASRARAEQALAAGELALDASLWAALLQVAGQA